MHGACSESTWHKIHIIRCGLHFSQSDQQPTPVPATHQLLNIGRLSKEKGQLQLLRAVARVVEAGIPVRLILAGDGPMRPLLESEIDRLCLHGVVKLAGWVGGATVADLLRSSRALVVSSFAEGLPIVLMECFRAGRPAIAANVGGIAELVEPGVSGWLVPPGDEARLAACMREVLTASPEQLTRMGQAGYATVQQMHDVRCEAQKLSDLFAEVMTDAPPAFGGRPNSRIRGGEAARY
ncbi:MAG: glycosyltransferase family 4 protein [Phycisphaerales bacterium]|nr:MAG: glycosyltransferase family 4 protein [Phycisphaerales bacterium]